MFFTWLESLSVMQQFLIGVPAAGAAIVAIWKLGLRANRFSRSLASGLAKLDQFDPAQLDGCVRNIGVIMDTLGPNGGKSLYDKVDAATNSARRSEARLSTILDVVFPQPLFMTDKLGEFTWVNAAFERDFETSCDDVAGRGWINLLLPADRDRVVREWRHAVEDRRAFHTHARCLTQRGAVQLMCKWNADPVPVEPDSAVIGWMGTITIIAPEPAHVPEVAR